MSVEGAILKNTFHHSEFSDKKKLVSLKEKRGVSISLGFPTLNEEKTVGKEILVLKTELMDRFPLIDEIAVIDSGSVDRTCSVAAQYGAKVFISRDILKKYGTYKGKGENLWKSLYVLKGDIVVWIDADISNISPKFVYGLVGPLLERDDLSYIKAFYERPLASISELSPSGGGRVTEILVRPLFSLFYPELACLVQPLSGEYAGRRSLLESLPFSVGYGVEIGHLIDILHTAGVARIGQVDLDRRVHRNQSLQALSRMAFGIMTTFCDRLVRYGDAERLGPLHPAHVALSVIGSRHETVLSEIPVHERPPMAEIEEYAKRNAR